MRITKTHLRAAFDNLRLAAINAGVPGASNWLLREGNKTNGVSWVMFELGNANFTRGYTQNLTTDMRCAYERIVSMTHLLQYLRETQDSLPHRPGPVASVRRERGDAAR